ncbi:HigA family addiction module antitoxin [Herbaspirillum seropedicae]|uniref:HigA family addiction module antitoxin n=1 Tax=Herbaspirillum seropedicae TaxID=964 RepID=UPI0008483358|nr:HigA family addiction module antitoxin [Herbaspirillum seropedicae]AON53191.1 helix-turn-helix family protein [Herbaspirillum seropedicae]
MREIDSVSPGELLKREFLEPLCITQYRLAKEIGVSQLRISEIVNGKRAITADTDLRLARFFGLSDGYWLRAQVVHDTEVAREKMRDVLAGIKQWQPKESTPA